MVCIASLVRFPVYTRLLFTFFFNRNFAVGSSISNILKNLGAENTPFGIGIRLNLFKIYLATQCTKMRWFMLQRITRQTSLFRNAPVRLVMEHSGTYIFKYYNVSCNLVHTCV